LSVFAAFILSWYFGGVDFYLHPDRIIGSIISYSEKSIFRTGSYQEGLIAMGLNLSIVFFITALFLYFTSNTGTMWYFTFSTLIIYLSINKRCTDSLDSSNAAMNYLTYAMPVLFYSLLFGPIGAPIFRTLPLTLRMLPTSKPKYKEFSKPAHQVYTVTNDIANMLIPIIIILIDWVRKFVRFLKSFRP